MNVLIATDKGYYDHIFPMLASLFHNHYEERVDVYLLYTGLKQQQIRRLQDFAGNWKQKSVCAVEIPGDMLGSLKSFGRFSVAAYFRILAIELLPEEVNEILYLDIDVIINKNLQFFYQKCRACPFVACEDYNAVLQGNYVAHKSHIGLSSEKPYFNSGVLYMDIQYLRRNSYMQRLLEDIEASFSRYTLVDQDALNILMQDVVHFEKWQEYNCPAAYYYRKQDGSFLSYEEIRGLSSQTGDITNDTDRMVAEAAIIHYCIEVKPWDGGNFYEKSGMRKALQVYQRYQKMAERLLRKASTDG